MDPNFRVGLLKTIPRPGEWIAWIEKGFGFAMILLGEYLLIKAGNLLMPDRLF
jgi:thiol:disulfide interchange protein